MSHTLPVVSSECVSRYCELFTAQTKKTVIFISLVDKHISPYFLMLVWWQKSRYKINYSHFFWGVWHGVLQWRNVQTHKIIISACTHWLSTYHNIPVHVSCLAAATFDLFLRCVWCIILLEKGKHCGVFRGEGCNASDTYLFPLSLVFVCNLL